MEISSGTTITPTNSFGFVYKSGGSGYSKPVAIVSTKGVNNVMPLAIWSAETYYVVGGAQTPSLSSPRSRYMPTIWDPSPIRLTRLGRGLEVLAFGGNTSHAFAVVGSPPSVSPRKSKAFVVPVTFASNGKVTIGTAKQLKVPYGYESAFVNQGTVVTADDKGDSIVIGGAWVGDGYPSVLVKWTNGNPLVMNNRMPHYRKSNLTYLVPNGINHYGIIIGQGKLNGHLTAVALTPPA